MIRNRETREGFLDAIREALSGVPGPTPESTTRLAEIRWPLVITTNYDDLFFYACRNLRQNDKQDWPGEILGRSPRDCKLVYSSLTGPFDREYFWHVQGFLGGPCGQYHEDDGIRIRELQDQLVIGHAEYRKATNRAPDFRRCFTEVF